MIEHAEKFFILGAGKAGTGFLYRATNAHPEICMSDPKEPPFFDAEYERGVDYFFDRYFQHYQNERWIGSARPANLWLPYVPPIIHRMFPRAKFIVSLRDPVTRAFSNWWMRYNNGLESLGFDDAVAANLAELETDGQYVKDAERIWRANLIPGTGLSNLRRYVQVGYYADHLNRYLAHFDRSQFLVIFYDDLAKNPNKTCEEIYGFLQVAPIEVDPRPANPAPSRLHAMTKNLFDRSGLRAITPKGVRQTAARSLKGVGSPPQMPKDTAKMLRRHFAPHDEKLMQLLGTDTLPWYERP